MSQSLEIGNSVDNESNVFSNALAVCSDVVTNFPSAVWEELSNDWNSDRRSTLLTAGSALATGAATAILCRKFPAVTGPLLAVAGSGTLLYGATTVGSFLGEAGNASTDAQRSALINLGTKSMGRAGAFALETMPALLVGTSLGLGGVHKLASKASVVAESRVAESRVTMAPVSSAAETPVRLAPVAATAETTAVLSRAVATVETTAPDVAGLRQISQAPQYNVDAARRFEGRASNFSGCAEDYYLKDLKIDPAHPNPMQAQFELARELGQLEKYRPHLIKRYAHAVPTEESLQFIGQHGPVVELGAGSGYWSSLLKNRGYDTVAYDSWVGYAYSPGATWMEVLKGDAKMLAKHADRTLFISWPSSGAASDALIHFKGNRFVYLGEQSPDIMADSLFFKILARDWKEVRSMPVPKLDGFNQDALYLYERKSRVEKLLERHREKVGRSLNGNG